LASKLEKLVGECRRGITKWRIHDHFGSHK
jgi:hypothetical protein